MSTPEAVVLAFWLVGSVAAFWSGRRLLRRLDASIAERALMRDADR